jgi:hypothetical protein
MPSMHAVPDGLTKAVEAENCRKQIAHTVAGAPPRGKLNGCACVYVRWLSPFNLYGRSHHPTASASGPGG